jgi:Holliday junction resolvasome RuvABC ATP-dependent DNA helicase subunit
MEPYEEGKRFQEMIAKFGMTQTEIAKNIGKNQEYVSTRINIFNRLPNEVKKLSHKLRTAHQRQLLRLNDAEEQIKLAIEVAKHKLSVRSLKRKVNKVLSQTASNANSYQMSDTTLNDCLVFPQYVVFCRYYISQNRKGKCKTCLDKQLCAMNLRTVKKYISEAKLIGETLSSWAEKYRPKKLEDLVGNRTIINQLKNFLKIGDFPHLLFHGPPGTGKTSAALCIAYETLGSLDLNLMQINAADMRKTDFQNRVFSFSRGCPLGSKKRIVMVDECEKMTPDTCTLLRTTIEDRSCLHTRFILICNDITKISDPNDALKSRFIKMEFKKPTADEILHRLKYIANAESVPISENQLKTIANQANGDVRQAINLLQAKAAEITVRIIERVRLGDKLIREALATI